VEKAEDLGRCFVLSFTKEVFVRVIRGCITLFLTVLIFVAGNTLFAANVSVDVQKSISLFQPDDVLPQRLWCGYKGVAEYSKRIGAALSESFHAAGELQPTTGAIMVVVKPQYQAKFWLMSSEYPIPERISDDLRGRFSRVRPPAVQAGPVAFAVFFTINGGGKPLVTEANPVPLPPDWEKVARKLPRPIRFPEDILAVVWPDEPGASQSALTVPDGFELQMLDATGGSILKPKSWFYAFSRDAHNLVWTISKEDPHPDGYRIGLRIQLVPEASKSAKKSPQAIAEEIMAAIRKSAKVLNECAPEKAGVFTSACLETKETIATAGKIGEYHVLHKTSWSNEMDMVSITTFGTPYGEWNRYQDIYCQMKNSILIGKDLAKEAQGSEQAQPKGCVPQVLTDVVRP